MKRTTMMITRRAALAAALAVLPLGWPAAQAEDAAAADMVITLSTGEVVIRMRPDLAPRHVERITQLVNDGAYNGVAFHRVIDGFMAQTGDVEHGNIDTGTYSARLAGTGGSTYGDLEAEFTDKASFTRGMVGMARSRDPNSANSQFFIMLAPAPHLDGAYTIFGEVVSGMEHVDEIKKGPPEANGAVIDPDRMIAVRMAPAGA